MKFKLLTAAALSVGLTSPAAAQYACDWGNLHSLSSNTHKRFAVTNRNQSRNILMYWINFDGEPILYSDVPPKGKVVHNTYEGHLWVIVDSTGECEAMVMVETAMDLVIR